MGEQALATIAVGSCAFDGGLPLASGGPTAAVGVSQLLPGKQVINLPGCPMNVQNLTATIVHYLTFKEFPATDSLGRPLFAYGQLIHDQCERRAHFDSGEYVLCLGRRGTSQGLVPLQDGLQGAGDLLQLSLGAVQRFHVLAGQGRPRLRGLHHAEVLGRDEPLLRAATQRPRRFPSDVTADQIGLGLLGGVAALTAAHAGASYVRGRRQHSLHDEPPHGPALATESSADGDAQIGEGGTQQ